LLRTNSYHKVMAAGCSCGCYTCVSCGEVEHSPLSCKDAATWSDIRKRVTGEMISSMPSLLWRQSLASSSRQTSGLNNIFFKSEQYFYRFMKTYDRVNGRTLEKDMPYVARLLEMRRVQQLAQRKELQPVSE
ncbi:hypothetical protein PENTCL1PPCAC_3788, partial [Pristionchus entomophagus]